MKVVAGLKLTLQPFSMTFFFGVWLKTATAQMSNTWHFNLWGYSPKRNYISKMSKGILPAFATFLVPIKKVKKKRFSTVLRSFNVTLICIHKGCVAWCYMQCTAGGVNENSSQKQRIDNIIKQNKNLVMWNTFFDNMKKLLDKQASNYECDANWKSQLPISDARESTIYELKRFACIHYIYVKCNFFKFFMQI